MEYAIEWRAEPSQVWLQCSRMNSDIQQIRALNEIVVHFEINGSKYTAFVPEEFVDVEKRLISALIVADYGNDYLLDLPVETLTSGVRFRIPEAEKGNLVVA